MSRRNVFTLVAAGLLLFGAAPAFAQSGAPQTVPIQGYLTDSEGAPVDGDVDLTVKVYNADDMVLHEETLEVTADNGSFTAYLGTNTPVDLTIFRDNTELSLGFAVDGGPEMEPRIPLGTAPYAGFAEHAAKADTAAEAENAQQLGGESPDAYAQPDWGDIQNVPDSANTSYSAEAPVEIDSNDTIKLQSSCADGEVLKWDGSSSSWACATDDAGNYSGTSGVEVDNSNETVGLTSSCSADQILKYTDGSWSCEADADTEYQAGTGLTRTSNQFSVDTSAIQTRVTGSCSNPGSYMVGINQDGSAMCANGVYEVNAGTGLAGGGTSPSIDLRIPSGGISSNEIGGDQVGTSELAEDAVTSTELDDNSVDSARLQDNAVTSSHIDDGSIQNADVAANASIAPGKINGTAATLDGGASFNGSVTADGFDYSSTKTVKKNISIADFVVDDNQESVQWQYDRFDGLGYIDDSGGGIIQLVASLDSVPSSATITNFTIYFFDDEGSSNNISGNVDLRETSFTAGGSNFGETINNLSFSSSGTSSNVQSSSNTLTYDVNDNNGLYFDLYVNSDASGDNLGIVGVSIEYTVSGPTP